MEDDLNLYHMEENKKLKQMEINLSRVLENADDKVEEMGSENGEIVELAEGEKLIPYKKKTGKITMKERKALSKSNKKVTDWLNPEKAGY